MRAQHDESMPMTADGWKRRAIALERGGRYEEAARAYGEATRLDPDDVDAQGRLGLVLRELGRDDDANAAFLAALDVRGALGRG